MKRVGVCPLPSKDRKVVSKRRRPFEVVGRLHNRSEVDKGPSSGFGGVECGRVSSSLVLYIPSRLEVLPVRHTQVRQGKECPNHVQ